MPEPKYFFNHCTSLFQEGKFGEALTACNAADKNADDKLKDKIAKLVEQIHDEAKKQNIDLQPVGGGGGPGDTPPGGDPNNPNQSAPTRINPPPGGGQAAAGPAARHGGRSPAGSRRCSRRRRPRTSTRGASASISTAAAADRPPGYFGKSPAASASRATTC